MEKRLIMYVAIIIVCIIAIGIGVYSQLFGKETETNPLNFISSNNKQQEEIAQKEEAVKNDFNNIFKNTLVYTNDNVSTKAVRKVLSKDLIYTNNQIAKIENGKYELNINVPTININSQVADKINNEIEQIFITKASSILTTENLPYTIYNIDYVGYATDNILSLVIKATLKEGQEPQRVMVISYNYNLETGNFVTLDDLLALKSVTKATLQYKIDKEIREISKKTEDLQSIGYPVYTRNVEDSMYKVENINNFFLGDDGYVYIVYAYRK